MSGGTRGGYIHVMSSERGWDLAMDHVVIAVDDLDAASTEFQDRYGLASVPGGRHRGLGTGNRIIPLGNSTYIEMIAIVDEEEAAMSPLAQVVRTFASSDSLGMLCLRTNSIEEVARSLGEEPISMSRDRPGGDPVRWQLAGFMSTLQDPSLPFFIRWEMAPEDHPGAAEVEHPAGEVNLEWVEIAADAAAIGERLGDHALDIRVTEGLPGVRAIGLRSGSVPLIIRGAS